MLSRVADALYWTSRYIERAENNARLANVNIQLMIDFSNRLHARSGGLWEPVLNSLEDKKLFFELYSEADSSSVLNFLTFDRRNPNSISSCIASARENARTVREQISTEMWEHINKLYLFSRAASTREAMEENTYQTLKLFVEGSQFFQGVTDTTMNHHEGWEFIQLGKYTGRADQISRILDLKYHMLLPSGERVGGTVDTIEWMAVLSTCSALEAYRKEYVGAVAPWQVAEFLILHPRFPRSIYFCVQQVDAALRRISGSDENQFSNHAEQLSGRLRAQLAFSTIHDIYQAGLHEYLDQIQLRLIEITDAIYKAYCDWMPRDVAVEQTAQ
jgi:uncharacterized alpha-E superfamily protein